MNKVHEYEALDLEDLDHVSGGSEKGPAGNVINYGMGTYFAGTEAALLYGGQHGAAEMLGGVRAFGAVPAVGVAVDLISHGVPQSGSEWGQVAVVNGISTAVGWGAGVLAAETGPAAPFIGVGAAMLTEKVVGPLSDLVTGNNRYGGQESLIFSGNDKTAAEHLPTDFNGQDLRAGYDAIQQSFAQQPSYMDNYPGERAAVSHEYIQNAQDYITATNTVDMIHNAQESLAAYNPFESHGPGQFPTESTQHFDDGSTLSTHNDGTITSTPATDGAQVQHFDDGSVLTTHADGTTSATDAPAETTQHFDDGSALTTHEDGSTSATEAPSYNTGESTQHFDDGSSLTTHNDGSTSATEAPSYQNESSNTGSSTQQFDDGSSLTTYSNGSTSATEAPSYESSSSSSSSYDGGGSSSYDGGGGGSYDGGGGGYE